MVLVDVGTTSTGSVGIKMQLHGITFDEKCDILPFD